MTPPAPVDNVATALGLDTMEARDYVLRAYEDLLTRYRTLRGHVRKDGAIKLALPKAVAEREALRLTEKYGRPYTAYPCPICNGMWHTGCDRDDLTTTPEDTNMGTDTEVEARAEANEEAALTVTTSGASDDIVSIIDIVFDGPPSHESGRFVEVEDADGKSISIGEWVTRPDDPEGWAALRIPDPRPDTADADQSEPEPPRYDGDTANLDRARAYLDKQIGGNSQWTGPHPDWTAHTVAVVVEAGLRDIVAAVRAVGDRVGDAVDAHATEIGRQRS